MKIKFEVEMDTSSVEDAEIIQELIDLVNHIKEKMNENPSLGDNE